MTSVERLNGCHRVGRLGLAMLGLAVGGNINGSVFARLIALAAHLPPWHKGGMTEELPPLRLDGPSMMAAAMAYHMRRCLDALGERRVQRIMGLERYQVQGVALGTMALTSRRRDLLDRLFVAVMLLDGVEPWEWEDEQR